MSIEVRKTSFQSFQGVFFMFGGISATMRDPSSGADIYLCSAARFSNHHQEKRVKFWVGTVKMHELKIPKKYQCKIFSPNSTHQMLLSTYILDVGYVFRGIILTFLFKPKTDVVLPKNGLSGWKVRFLKIAISFSHNSFKSFLKKDFVEHVRSRTIPESVLTAQEGPILIT